MKRSRYIWMAAALALTACTNTEDFGDTTTEQGSISFSTPFVNKAVTRATGDIADGKALQDGNVKISVWAEMYDKNSTYDEATKEPVFDKTELAYEGSQWIYTGGTKFWDGSKKYDFAAFAPRNAAATVAYTNGKFNITNIPAVQLISNADSKAGDDYLVSQLTSTEKSTSGDAGVNLTFKHILSRLSVYAWTDLNSTYTVTLNSLKLYLPGSGVTAGYTETSHSGPTADDTWVWTGFTNATDIVDVTTANGYGEYTVTGTDFTVPYATDKTTAANNKASEKLPQEFFVIPTEKNASIDLYMDITYTVAPAAGGASKQITKSVPVSELKQFKQGYQTNLFVCINPSVITFNVEAVEGWNTDNNYVDDKGHSFSFTAAQKDFHIEGTLDNKGNTVVGTTTTPIAYTATALVKNGGTENILKAEVPLTIGAEEGSYSIASENIDLAKLESGATYTLTIASNMNDQNTADVSFSFDAMQFKVKTTAASTQFTMPIATGATPAIAILWGDTDGKDDKEILTVDATNRAKTYATAGTYTVRLLASQTDRALKQIPEFNFGKYPTVTWDGNDTYNRNTNAEMLTSVDSQLLNSEATDLGGVFYGTANLSSINEDAFRYYPNATSFYDAFYTVSAAKNQSLTSIPSTLFANNTKVANFCETFGNLTALTSIPENLFANNTAATDMSWTFTYCSALTAIPAEVFKNNEKITTFSGTFYSCSGIKSVPAGLFDNNLEVTTFRQTFCFCSALETVPDGLLALNTKAYSFYQTFRQCKMLIFNINVFINDINTKQTRFGANSQATTPIDLTNVFSYSGTNRSNQTGAAPDFWNYTFKDGYTWTKSSSGISYQPYAYLSTATYKATNYDDIPNLWASGTYPTESALSGWKNYPY